MGLTDLELTALGFGSAALGNLYTAVSDEQARATVDAAWDAGIRYFDTAPHYGLGLAERRLGAALAGRPRSEFVVSTKVGRLLVDSGLEASDLAEGGFDLRSTLRREVDFSADGVRRSLDESLVRLGLDRVDIVYVHDPDAGAGHERQVVEETLPALCALRDQGVIGAVGVGMNQWQMPARLVGSTDLDLVLLAGRYTLLEQKSLTGLLDLCARQDVAVVAGAPFNSGLLASDDPPADATWNYAPAPAGMLARARALAAACTAAGVRLPAAALQFPLAHRAVVSVLAGMRSPDEVAANAAMIREALPAALWAELVRLGLLPPEAPTPKAAAAA